MRLNQPITQHSQPVTPDMVILSTADRKGLITSVNEDFVRISGYSAEELLGQPHNILRHPDMPRQVFADMWNTLKSGRSWVGLIKNRCKNGDHYWVHAYATPIVDSDGQIVEIQSVRTAPRSQAAVARAEKHYHLLRAAEPDRGPVGDPPPPRWSPGLAGRLAFLLLAVGGGQLLLQLSAGAPAGTAALSLLPLLAALAALPVLLRPLHRLAERSRREINQPWMQQILTGRQDDLGQIEMALLSLESEFGAVTHRLNYTMEQLRASITSTAVAVQEANELVHELNVQTEQVAVAVDQMSVTVQDIARSGTEAANATHEAGEEAESGRTAGRQSRDAMEGLVSQVELSATVIKRLFEEAGNISQVLDVIRQVTQQTNLLALNAAIEAARAGESGRGFAVVADEVRVLASRTHASTHQIGDIIETLRQAAQEAVEAMAASQRLASAANERSRESEACLERIGRAVDSIRSLNIGVAGAIEEQSSVATAVNQSIGSIKTLYQAADERINAIASQTERVVEEVERTCGLVNRFVRAAAN